MWQIQKLELCKIGHNWILCFKSDFSVGKQLRGFTTGSCTQTHTHRHTDRETERDWENHSSRPFYGHKTNNIHIESRWKSSRIKKKKKNNEATDMKRRKIVRIGWKVFNKIFVAKALFNERTNERGDGRRMRPRNVMRRPGGGGQGAAWCEWGAHRRCLFAFNYIDISWNEEPDDGIAFRDLLFIRLLWNSKNGAPINSRKPEEKLNKILLFIYTRMQFKRLSTYVMLLGIFYLALSLSLPLFARRRYSIALKFVSALSFIFAKKWKKEKSTTFILVLDLKNEKKKRCLFNRASGRTEWMETKKSVKKPDNFIKVKLCFHSKT